VSPCFVRSVCGGAFRFWGEAEEYVERGAAKRERARKGHDRIRAMVSFVTEHVTSKIAIFSALPSHPRAFIIPPVPPHFLPFQQPWRTILLLVPSVTRLVRRRAAAFARTFIIAIANAKNRIGSSTSSNAFRPEPFALAAVSPQSKVPCVPFARYRTRRICCAIWGVLLDRKGRRRAIIAKPAALVSLRKNQ